MKKITTIIVAAALLAALAGCNGNSASEDSENSNLTSTSNSAPESSEESESSDTDNSEPHTPAGEATFLVGLDGEPIYTGEITECYIYEEREKLPATNGFTPENFAEATCDGFTYAYIPRPAVNFMENPELFEANKDGDMYSYIGEPLEPSSEFTKVYINDKLGDFTVEAAKAYFSPLGYDGSDEAGEFYSGGYIKLSGDVELTGYVTVTEEAPLYPGNGGNINFYPDSESSVKIPHVLIDREYKTFKPIHFVEDGFYGWYGDGATFSLGNISEYDCGLREGDLFVKVKVTVSGAELDGESGGSVKVDVKDIELIN